MKHITPMALALFMLGSCASKKEILDIPIIFDDQRIELTEQYMAQRYGLDGDSTQIVPRMVVLHWTAIPSLKGSFEAFNRSTLPQGRPELVNVSGLNASAPCL